MKYLKPPATADLGQTLTLRQGSRVRIPEAARQTGAPGPAAPRGS